jgi:hypothetical protein
VSRALLAGALLAVLWPDSARAGATEKPSGDAGQAASSQSSTPTSDEDREVIENLDLLQAMDGARDLDLLLELNQADANGE